ncbi:MAG: hypothetical protein EOP06_21435, partial [Proteobacteria bacterium]
MVKAVGDRIAEALAEAAHKYVRKLFGVQENLTNAELIE